MYILISNHSFQRVGCVGPQHGKLEARSHEPVHRGPLVTSPCVIERTCYIIYLFKFLINLFLYNLYQINPWIESKDLWYSLYNPRAWYGPQKLMLCPMGHVFCRSGPAGPKTCPVTSWSIYSGERQTGQGRQRPTQTQQHNHSATQNIISTLHLQLN